MKLLHLNTFDDRGGAARAVYGLHRALTSLGEDSTLLVRYKSGADPTVDVFRPSGGLNARVARVIRQEAMARDARRHLVESYEPGRSLEARLCRRLDHHALKLRRRLAGDGERSSYEQFSDDRCVLSSDLADKLPEADVILLNWVAGFVDYSGFFSRLPDRRPLVWRLADMNAFTGGCHYDGGCGRFARACGSCPQLARRHEDDLSRQIWLRKREALDCLTDDGLHVVALSRSQAETVGRSSLLGRFPLSVIPCGVDVEAFHPLPRILARRTLGLPPGEPLLLMVAENFARPAKGAGLLGQALALMSRTSRPLLLTVGDGLPASLSRHAHVHFGAVGEAERLALIYSAADLLAFPSVQEAFGQTVIEALACGLPVAGFDTGGVRDAVEPGTTGFVAATMTAAALAETLESAFSDVERLRALSRGCRDAAVRDYSWGTVAARYQDLFRRMLRPASRVNETAEARCC